VADRRRVERSCPQTAEFLGARLGLRAQILHELGENDRSASGFLEADVFEVTALSPGAAGTLHGRRSLDA
jgi:hypothetical protein